MTLEALHSDDATAEAAPYLPLRNSRIVTPETAARIDAQRASDAIAACSAEMRKQFGFMADASSIAGRLKTLADMYQHALCAVDGSGDAIDYGYLVADVIETMVSRLEALEQRARESLKHCEAQVAR